MNSMWIFSGGSKKNVKKQLDTFTQKSGSTETQRNRCQAMPSDGAISDAISNPELILNMTVVTDSGNARPWAWSAPR